MLDRIEHVLSVLDDALDNKKKRHIIGGMLMSIAFFFGRPVNNSYYT